MGPKHTKQLLLPICTVMVFSLAIMSPVSSTGDSFSILDQREMVLSGTTVDIAVSSDGRWTFVLTSGGEIAIYGVAGDLVQTLKVDKGYNTIEYSPAGNKLILGGPAKRELSVLTLTMVYDLDYSGSPFRGPANAPVTIAVFNDFQ